MRLLIASNDASLAETLDLRLGAEGFAVDTIDTAEDALEDLRIVASLKPLAELDQRMCEQLRLKCAPEDQPKKPVTAPCYDASKQLARGIVRSVKTVSADGNGIVLTRFPLRHDQ